MAEWREMSAADLGRAIGRGEIDPEELTAAHLDAIRVHAFRDRIYARVTEARALEEAKAAAKRAKAGQRLSALDGVPISWKDLFDTAGTATEAGSLLLEGRVPGADAEVLRNATLQGLVCLGKTHMTELAFSGLGLNPKTATPPNIHDPALAPGGSSSGAAASVAFGLAAAGIGSDTGGSVRVPAAWNDLVGLKTTSGRLSLKGVVPLCARFDTVGPLTRTVEDAALLLAAMEGAKPADLRAATLKDARFLVLENVALDDIRPEPLAGFNHALERINDAGATLVRGAVPELAHAMDLSGILFTTEAYGTWKSEIEAAPEKMFPPVRDRFRSGAGHSGADYVAAWRWLEEIRAIWAERTAGYDAVLVPTVPNLPPEAERLLTDNDYFVAENLLTLRNTRIGNLMGLSALTLPTGLPATGITLLGRPFAEERLLRLGAAAETALR
ncbi:Glutamyl-tRNA(Gln) amidotransferase subunit A [Defluviimonas aquaemixtae]|uniref:Glutamyl-tRNA(Gln) amidotransferase subunit A n=1 Tax=Albidovulum aquaemixtae TaxID=1542388 RepID=A0A2R8BL26_9RHOB|nr:amidase family protein [Defluviimonas aquaemixtae]SPH24127.1 Glutamyl-tRNA(Gln) amidotransferase subunit A [Defluviimonas aquaemixtae]